VFSSHGSPVFYLIGIFFTFNDRLYDSQVISETDAVPSGYADAVVNESISVYLESQGTNSAEAEQVKIKKIDELKKYVLSSVIF